jgi:hypothetical protein
VKLEANPKVGKNRFAFIEAVDLGLLPHFTTFSHCDMIAATNIRAGGEDK